jgi:hypothetical protein
MMENNQTITHGYNDDNMFNYYNYNDDVQAHYNELISHNCIDDFPDHYISSDDEYDSDYEDGYDDGYDDDNELFDSLHSSHSSPMNIMNQFIKIDNDMEYTCPICLENGNKNDNLVQSPCNHVYHHKCMEEWLSCGDFCPVCRFKYN